MTPRFGRCFVPSLVVFLALLASHADAATLWYNGDYDNRDALANGTSAPNRNPTVLQVSKVYENFVVPVGQTWTITSVSSVNEILNGSGIAVTTASWEIRSGVSAGNGGTVRYSGDTAATQTAVTQNPNYTYGFNPYTITATVPSAVLTAGTYWLSVVPDDSTPYYHDQSYVETTSGLNAVGTPAGNDGNSYITNNLATGSSGAYNFTSTSSVEGGGNWDYVMGVNGTVAFAATVPEPASLTLVGLGLLGAMIGVRRRPARPC